MKVFPKVTFDREEFWNSEKPECEMFYQSAKDFWSSVEGAKGLCGHSTIWLESLSPITLLHELIHYPIVKIYLKAITFKSPSIALFLDFLHALHDFINGVLRREDWKNHVHEAFHDVVAELNDFLDWVLRREVC